VSGLLGSFSPATEEEDEDSDDDCSSKTSTNRTSDYGTVA
jgi:hypothetical protein